MDCLVNMSTGPRVEADLKVEEFFLSSTNKFLEIKSFCHHKIMQGRLKPQPDSFKIKPAPDLFA